MVEAGPKRVNVKLQGPDVSAFPLAFFFLCKDEPPSFNRRSPFNRPLPRENFLPYSVGKVDGGFRKSIALATDFLGKYSQMTTDSASPTRSEGCAEEGHIKPVEERGSEGAGALWMW